MQSANVWGFVNLRPTQNIHEVIPAAPSSMRLNGHLRYTSIHTKHKENNGYFHKLADL
jgi:hypothetical protein